MSSVKRLVKIVFATLLLVMEVTGCGVDSVSNGSAKHATMELIRTEERNYERIDLGANWSNPIPCVAWNISGNRIILSGGTISNDSESVLVEIWENDNKTAFLPKVGTGERIKTAGYIGAELVALLLSEKDKREALVFWGEDGKERLRVDISKLLPSISRLGECEILSLSNGKVLLNERSSGTVFSIGRDGYSQILLEYPAAENVGALFDASLQRIILIRRHEDGIGFYDSANADDMLCLCPKEYGLSAVFSRENGIFGVSPFALYRIDIEQKAVFETLRFSDYGLSLGNIVALEVSSSNDVTIIQRTDVAEFECCRLNRKNGDTFSDEIVLSVLKTSDALRYVVNRYNRTHPECVVRIKEYYQSGIDASMDSALLKMNADIADGSAGDLIAFVGTNIAIDRRDYVKQGLLLDLDLFIDSDHEFRKEDYICEIWEANKIDGALFNLTPYFKINTYFAKAEENDHPIHLDESIILQATNPKGIIGKNATFEDFLFDVCVYSLPHEKDMLQGSMLFDHEKLEKYIWFAGELCEEYDQDGAAYDIREMKEGCQLLFSAGYCRKEDHRFGSIDRSLGGFRFAAAYFPYEKETYYQQRMKGASEELLHQIYSEAGAEVSPVGFPVAEGCGSAFRNELSFAILSSSEKHQDAWRFLKAILTDDFQSDFADYLQDVIPVNKKAFDTAMDDLLDISNAKTHTWDMTGLSDPDDPLDDSKMQWLILPYTKQEYVEDTKRLIKSITKVEEADHNVYSILVEETKRYMDGHSTLEQAVDYIQNRISLYLNE